MTWIQFELGCKLVEKILKCTCEYGVKKKLWKDRSYKRYFHASLFGNKLNRLDVEI